MKFLHGVLLLALLALALPIAVCAASGVAYDFGYSPTMIQANVSEVVTITLVIGTHTVTSFNCSQAGSSNPTPDGNFNQDLNVGPFSMAFNVAGQYCFYDANNPNMQGVIVVGAAPSSSTGFPNPTTSGGFPNPTTSGDFPPTAGPSAGPTSAPGVSTTGDSVSSAASASSSASTIESCLF